MTELFCDNAASPPDKEQTLACRAAMESSRTAVCCLLTAGAGGCWVSLTAKPNQDLAAQNPGLYPGNPKKYVNNRFFFSEARQEVQRKEEKGEKKKNQKKPTLLFKGFLPICKYTISAKHKRLPAQDSAVQSHSMNPLYLSRNKCLSANCTLVKK